MNQLKNQKAPSCHRPISFRNSRFSSRFLIPKAPFPMVSVAAYEEFYFHESQDDMELS